MDHVASIQWGKPMDFRKRTGQKNRENSTHFQTALNKVPPEAFFSNSPPKKMPFIPIGLWSKPIVTRLWRVRCRHGTGLWSIPRSYIPMWPSAILSWFKSPMNTKVTTVFSIPQTMVTRVMWPPTSLLSTGAPLKFSSAKAGAWRLCPLAGGVGFGFGLWDPPSAKGFLVRYDLGKLYGYQ